jgi:hypothetical protein
VDVLVRFNLKVHPKQKIMYIPRTLLNVIGLNPIAIPNSSVAVLHNSETDPLIVVRELEHLLRGLRLDLKAKTATSQAT